MLGFFSTILMVLFIIVCLLLIGVVLLQKGRGGGLGAALGGAGSSAFGTKTGDVMTWVTIVLTGLFLLLAVVTVVATRTPPDKVPAVRFSVKGGPIDPNTEVAVETRVGSTRIYITRDGSEPTEKANEVVDNGETILVDPPAIIKARAYRSGWEPSDVASVSYVEKEPELPGDANMPADANIPVVDANEPADANLAE
jgi:preprotein translocase subunit SecG